MGQGWEDLAGGVEAARGGGALAGGDIDQGEDPEAETEGFVVSDQDDADQPAAQLGPGGATADPVQDYLRQVGKVPLLNAAQEVELAKRIEAGLVAENTLTRDQGLAPTRRGELECIAADGRRAKNELVELHPPAPR